ncbi:hypothetical protein [Streptomyces sp. NPDC001404]|uniref:hypothetical protein n=1 Tax=Streptomyces sp. NPDC001404 TaxID=3364571 RepID=UPI0036B4A4A4
MENPAYPDVQVRLSGQDGNAHNVIGLVARALREAGHREAATEFAENALKSGSYDELLQLALRTVSVS